MLDESEFLSPHGIRALSRFHMDHPYVLNVHGMEHRVDYQPAESKTSLFGGNSNRSEEHTSELQSRLHLVCRLLLEKKKNRKILKFGLDLTSGAAPIHLQPLLALHRLMPYDAAFVAIVVISDSMAAHHRVKLYHKII